MCMFTRERLLTSFREIDSLDVRNYTFYLQESWLFQSQFGAQPLKEKQHIEEEKKK